MAELHPGPDVSLGQLEAQLRALGMGFNRDFFYARLGGDWALTLSDENYQRWQDAHGALLSTQDAGGEDDKDGGEDEAAATAKASAEDDKQDAEADEKSDDKTDEKSDTTSRRTKSSSKAR